MAAQVFLLIVTLCFRYGYGHFPIAQKPMPPDEQRLIEEVFDKDVYDSSARPVYNASHNVEVTFGFTLLKILDMEEKNQVLVTNAWLELIWRDERISWNPADYNGLKIVRIPADMLWLPDIVLYNNADDFTTGFMPGRAMVSHDGAIFWGPPVRLRSSCLLDASSFPFDSQSCVLKFGSWTYPVSQVDILNMRPKVDVSRYVSNGEWQLVGYTTTRYETVYPGPGNVTYSDVKVRLVIQRRTLYYIMNILFSCIWLSILTLLDFCLPPDEGEKITLGATVLLSYAFFMLLVANSVPPSSESLPLLGIYLTLSLAVNSASLSLTMLVLKLHHSPAGRNEVPYWVRVVVLDYLSRLVGCHCPPLKRSSKLLEGKPKKEEDELNSEVCKSLISSTVPWTPVTCDIDDIKDIEGLEDMATMIASTPLNRSTQGSFSESTPLPRLVHMAVLNQMSRYIGYLASNAQEDTRRLRNKSEWKQVALVVDRFFFWLFLFITVLSTFAVLLIVPSQRYAADSTHL